MTLGQKLRSLREGRALTQEKMIDLLGNIISQGRLSDIELDKPKKRDFIIICKICEFFDITPNALWNEIKDDPEYNIIIPDSIKHGTKRKRVGGRDGA